MENPTFKAESLEDFDKKLLEQMRCAKPNLDKIKDVKEFTNQFR